MAERLVSAKAPQFKLDCVNPDGSFGKADLEENIRNGVWTVFFFYPMDFTFVCPTEITAFSDRYEDFKKLNADIIGCSCDTIYTHQQWMKTSRKEGGIGKINFRLAADHTHEAAEKYGVLIEEEGVALRGLFIIDPSGNLRYSVVNDNNIGRSVDETLRVLQALQTGGMCPANWQPGDDTLHV
ncbi:peroxiredoxin [Sporolactobacillus sp. Y61]|jgi:alkyl hydroperoxide reductase subunit AhpC|uniref:Peroxiredoxin n=1 Tax=Sporolactobacillus sp. Y61 TaxID=3160863 RepID=A0AAU8IH35_9BACL|nr:peroxiredoxin [Sporolactobacillus sp. THM19-2]RYL93990.1 peroxiredoxin [Sporolactobacillus sp. THM19-2]